MDALFAVAMLTAPFWCLLLGGAVARLCPRYFDVIADRIDPHSAHRAAVIAAESALTHRASTTSTDRDSGPITHTVNPGLESDTTITTHITGAHTS